MNTRILLAEDDIFLRDGLSQVLESEKYDVDCVVTCKDAKELIFNNNYNLIILDVILLDGNSVELCDEIRKSGIDTPILFLSACDDEINIVRGLDAGGDDYVIKPFKLRELLSRIRAILRRTSSNIYSSNGITLDMQNMQVRNNGETVFLTPTEFHILSTLIRNSGIIVTRNQLLDNIWDNDGNFIDDNTLSVHISRLREKIGSDRILTVRGIGYRWEENA